ncbi:MAG TPA: STAS domain-containing protein [Planctomycetaceae bacterium]|nr:STAS domain-containing protein [Planctomycetaceae bacterium]
MQTDLGALVVYDAGPSTLVGFRGVDQVDDVLLDDCVASLERLLREHECQTLIVDLSGINLVSSGVLGYLFALTRRGIRVRVYNPGESVREVLQVTRLNSVLCEVDLPH